MDKVKRWYLGVCLLLLMGCGNKYDDEQKDLKEYGKVVTISDVTERNGRFYDNKTNQLYTGLVKSYYDNKDIKFRIPLKDGQENGVVQAFFENGKLQAEGEYKAGKKVGIHKIYNEKGKVIFEGQYKDDKENGVLKSFNNDGELQSEKTYKMGVLDGVQRIYDNKNGNIVEARFENGVMVDPPRMVTKK